MKCFPILLCLVSCAPTANFRTKAYVEAYQDYTLWPDPSAIDVCWEPSDSLTTTYQSIISEAVTREYQRAGITFVFGGLCEPSSPGIHILVESKGADYTAAIGALLNGKVAGMHLNVSRRCGSGIDETTCVINTALHEFGHALGLHHEMNRRDHRDCDRDQTEGRGEDSALQFGLYDSQSIMSYCRKRDRRELSENDIAAITDYSFAPMAKISGNVPLRARTDPVLLIEGMDIVAYRWQLTSDPERCTQVDDYSPEQSIDTFIHASMDTYTDGQRLHICVIGQNTAGHWQPLRSFSSVTFEKAPEPSL